MKSETATAGRNKNIPDPDRFIATLGDVNWTLFSQGKELSPVSQTLCQPFKAQLGKTSITGQVQILRSGKGEEGLIPSVACLYNPSSWITAAEPFL